MIFYRANHTALVVKLNSDEPLGILDTDYVEDFNGIDGQLSIFNTGTLDRTAMVMSAVPAETPGVDDDVFIGQVLLATLPNGQYQLQGRVRDLIGNHTILSDFVTPNGNEDVMAFEFEIAGAILIPHPARTLTVRKAPRVLESIVQPRTLPMRFRENVLRPEPRARLIVGHSNRVLAA